MQEMKILTLHVDYIKFKALKKALKSIGDLSDKEKEGSVKDALVVLTAVEKTDADVKSAVASLVKEVKDIASQVKTKNIVLYPYAHLSSNLGSPDTAMKVLEGAEKALKGFKVTRAPFGYYKEFELKVKGHPLSELSREIVLQGKEVEEKYDHKQLLREISKAKLDTSKLKQNDHRIIGKQMDMFSFNDVAPGMVFFHNNGLVVYNELIRFWRDLHRKYGYSEISTPQVMDKRLWQISGHWEKYKDNIFLTNYEKRDFAVKPMNCPGGLLVFKTTSKSYRDLPLRAAELGTVHRQELSGVLAGLFRVIKFTQDDAHIFCRDEKQLESELLGVMELVDEIYSKFGFKYTIELSTRPKKRIGTDAMWDKAEKALENVLKKQKRKYKVNKGDGAFYGPKIDFHLKDSLGRTWQCGTIQVDFAMPERFALEFTDKDNKKKRPIMIHRAIYGSLERFIGILIEHLNGRFPVWLAPVQVRVLNFTDRNKKAAEVILEKLRVAIPSLRADSDFSQSTMGSKVKNAEIMRVPYILTIGDKEEKAGTIAVRSKGSKKLTSEKIDGFISKLKKEISNRE
jgi:threonyl-tRNA synthetase